MSLGTIARWTVAVLVFMAIGVVDMRFGHLAGLGVLVLILIGLFVLDARSR